MGGGRYEEFVRMVDTECGRRFGVGRGNVNVGGGWWHRTGQLEVANVLAGRGLWSPAVHEDSETVVDGQAGQRDKYGR